MEKIFFGRTKIKAATALFHFSKKGIVQELMHNLKYRGHQEISGFLGAWLGSELHQNKRFEHIDMIIPVPLHIKKKRKRGYNQVTQFAQEIAKSLNVICDTNVLLKSKNTTTQVFKKRNTRSQYDAGIFKLQEGYKIRGKHLLLLDDIITTGATIEQCCEVLNRAQPASISVACMAITD